VRILLMIIKLRIATAKGNIQQEDSCIKKRIRITVYTHITHLKTATCFGYM